MFAHVLGFMKLRLYSTCPYQVLGSIHSKSGQQQEHRGVEAGRQEDAIPAQSSNIRRHVCRVEISILRTCEQDLRGASEQDLKSASEQLTRIQKEPRD